MRIEEKKRNEKKKKKGCKIKGDVKEKRAHVMRWRDKVVGED